LLELVEFFQRHSEGRVGCGVGFLSGRPTEFPRLTGIGNLRLGGSGLRRIVFHVVGRGLVGRGRILILVFGLILGRRLGILFGRFLLRVVLLRLAVVGLILLRILLVLVGAVLLGLLRLVLRRLLFLLLRWRFLLRRLFLQR